MVFPNAQALQAASIYTQQATVQQTGGIDISTLMNLMLTGDGYRDDDENDGKFAG